MPLIIKNFKWKQTDSHILIQVPFPNGTTTNLLAKADIFISSQYIKGSLQPYFFEFLLLHPVNTDESTCIKLSNEIQFNLKKCTPSEWEQLEIDGISKEDKMNLKKKFMEEEFKNIQEKESSKAQCKSELKKISVNEQIELDTKTRQKIESIKECEKNRALGNLNEWIEKEKNEKQVTKPNLMKAKEKSRKIPNKETIKQKKIIQPPKIRSTRSLQILFTPREFPTPCRESLLEEENEFLRKQAEARRSSGFVSDDLRPEEKNPQFLLAKGIEFLKNKNYLGAISAFSFGIKISPKFLDLYIARSEAHLNIGNFKKTAEDCSTALTLLKPPLPINLDDRALCTGRRAIALFKLGFTKQGIDELKASLKLKKSSEFEATLVEFEQQVNLD